MNWATILACPTSTCHFKTTAKIFASACSVVGFLNSATLAGHAGGMDNPGAPVVLPYELWAGLVGVAVLLLITIAWLAGNAWHLHKIDRRLRLLEEKQRQ